MKFSTLSVLLLLSVVLIGARPCSKPTGALMVGPNTEFVLGTFQGQTRYYTTEEGWVYELGDCINVPVGLPQYTFMSCTQHGCTSAVMRASEDMKQAEFCKRWVPGEWTLAPWAQQ